MKKTGYREMLRDRCPKVVNYALKWCKTKEAWLNHVYENWIWIYADKKIRLEATKNILGIKKDVFGKSQMNFVFVDTILWDNLTDEEKQMWERISNWVSWFQKNYAYIENAYQISKQTGKSIERIKYEIIANYLLFMCPTKDDKKAVKEAKNKKVNEFADFLISCLEQS